jgi:predicted acetyltransferase
MKAASAVWERFPGRWEVRVMQSNRTAFHFWSHAISAFVNAPIEPVHIEKEDVHWQVFTFESS